MSEIGEEANVPYLGWNRDCLKAARDRTVRRLGSRSGQRPMLGSALKRENLGEEAALDLDEVIQLRYSESNGEQRKRFGR